MPRGFEILYERGPCLVVLKPSGVLTQAPPGIDSLETRVKRFLRSRKPGPPDGVYLGVPHRLDRPVSGVLVLATRRRAARRLAEQFEARTLRKTYWAVVEGEVEEAEGTWTDHVRKTPGEARAEVVAPDEPDARLAVLRYRLLCRERGRSWLEIELETGRTHQIRVQSAARGIPVLGDFQYGAREPFGPDADNERLRCIALHARRLVFRDPVTRETVDVVGPPPPWWRDLGFPLDPETS